MSDQDGSARRHAFPGAILMGAQGRLIPYHIPLRFFVAATVFHLVAWLLLAAGHSAVAGFAGGPGMALAALHALTLGVLAMTVMGASYQLLNVAMGTAVKSLFLCRLSSWLYIPGVVALVTGMAIVNVHIMMLGGILVVAGLTIFGFIIADMFRRSIALKMTVRHGWAALVCLALLAVAGLLLMADFEHGFLGASVFPGHSNLAVGHAILGGFGFMGLMVMGFSYILIPMFTLSPAPDDRVSGRSFVLVLGGLVIAVSGALTGSAPAMLIAAVIGLGGVGLHLSLMIKALRGGMKKKLGLSFVMIRAGWVLLPLSIIIGGLAASGLQDSVPPPLFGFILIFGWLLTFLTGILQRILPFLASMHAHKLGKRAPRLSDMGHQGVTLNLHAVCHGIALVMVSVGIIGNFDTLILTGGVIGSIGAAAFLWFALDVSWRVVSFYTGNKTTT